MEVQTSLGSRMGALIDESDAKRRCVEGGALNLWTFRRRRFHVERSPQCLISRRCASRYGLRGTRVGEASNPGPPKDFRRLRRGVSSVSEPGSTVPASVRDIHVGHRALEDGGAPAFVDMSVDDSDQERPVRLTGNRFEVLSDTAEPSQGLPRRRLVLVSQNVGSDHEWDPDTESIAGASEVEVQDVHVESAPDLPIQGQDRVRGVQHAFATLDIVNLTEVFAQRARVMQSVPWVIRGAFRAAVKVAMQEILAGTEGNSEVRAARGWKLLLLLPRMILFRPLRGGNVSRHKLESRIVAFHEGRWMELLRESAVAAEAAHTQSVRRRRRQDHNDDARRAARAMTLTQMGELSAARQALEGAPVAPGTMSTLRALTDPEKRPPRPRAPLSPEVAEAQPVEAFELDSILTCLRRARRGAAAGPSGMTSDHLFPVLENEGDSQLLCRVA